MADRTAYEPVPHNHPDAMRPTIAVPTSQYSTYRPINHDRGGGSSSYPDSDLRLHSSPTTASDDPVNRPYIVGGGAQSQELRQYSDDIPLREHPQPFPPSTDLTYQNTPAVHENALAETAGYPSIRGSKGGAGPRKKKWWGHKMPWVVYILTLVQLSVFIAELVKNSILTQTPIEIHPQFNPMIGPSWYVLINMGARYVPCMKDVRYLGVTSTTPFPCPNATTLDVRSPMNQCTLAELCGFNEPGTFPLYQWYRFITPIFVHSGLVHIGFNLLLQMTLGVEIEKVIGSIRFFLVYFSSGIFGFVLGGNYAAHGIASMGASGALFGITAISLLDLLYTWGERRSPGKELALILVEIAVSLALGLLPGLDNFSHIGGLLMGLVLGICILRSPIVLQERTSSISSERTLASDAGKVSGIRNIGKERVGFFKGRKPLWWVWWLIRVGALIAVLVCFIVLLNNFYVYNDTCSWCKYLSCLNINGWCDLGVNIITNTTTSS